MTAPATPAALAAAEEIDEMMTSTSNNVERIAAILAKHFPATPPGAAPEAGFVLVPEGWKLVPQWPTEEQISNVKATAASCHMDRCKTPEVCAYHAAIEVAPAPPPVRHGRKGMSDTKTPAPDVAREDDGGRPLPFDRDQLGRFVREAWVRWAQTQPNPKPSWLVSYDALDEPDKEADRQIGEAIARWTLIGDAARAAPDLLAALSKAMSWIENWDVPFADDGEWLADKAEIRATLAKARGEG